MLLRRTRLMFFDIKRSLEHKVEQSFRTNLLINSSQYSQGTTVDFPFKWRYRTVTVNIAWWDHDRTLTVTEMFKVQYGTLRYRHLNRRFTVVPREYCDSSLLVLLLDRIFSTELEHRFEQNINWNSKCTMFSSKLNYNSVLIQSLKLLLVYFLLSQQV